LIIFSFVTKFAEEFEMAETHRSATEEILIQILTPREDSLALEHMDDEDFKKYQKRIVSLASELRKVLESSLD
jgi:hypothetical protein